MTKGNTIILVAGALIIVVLVLVLIFVPEDSRSDAVVEEIIAISPTTTLEIIEVKEGGEEISIGTTKPVPSEPGEEVPIIEPDLGRTISIPDTFTSEESKNVASNIADAIVAVKADETFENWFFLASLREEIGDYEGALEIYNYLGRINPEEAFSFRKAGLIYYSELIDFEKAEENFQKSIRTQEIEKWNQKPCPHTKAPRAMKKVIYRSSRSNYWWMPTYQYSSSVINILLNI